MNPHKSTLVGLLLGLAGIVLTGCTMAGARCATINTINRPTNATSDCPPSTVTGSAPDLDAGPGSQRQERRRSQSSVGSPPSRWR